MSENERPHKIVIIGAGNIGRELWKELTERGIADEVVIWNRPKEEEVKRVEAFMKGMNQANIIHASEDARLKPTSQFSFVKSESPEEVMQGADIVIVTAGLKRKPGQERKDLLADNCKLIDPLAASAKRAAPNATYIIATNPVDTLTQRFQEQSDILAERVIGLSGELDRSRFVDSICDNLKIPTDRIFDANVIGQHAPTGMIPTFQSVCILQDNGTWKKLSDYPTEVLTKIQSETGKGGQWFVDKIGESDYIAPAAALTKMAVQIAHARSGRHVKVLYGSAMGEEGVYIGRPVQFGAGGSYETLPLPEHNPAMWRKSVAECEKDLDLLPGRESKIRSVRV